jgi:hypothetical protein
MSYFEGVVLQQVLNDSKSEATNSSSEGHSYQKEQMLFSHPSRNPAAHSRLEEHSRRRTTDRDDQFKATLSSMGLWNSGAPRPAVLLMYGSDGRTRSHDRRPAAEGNRSGIRLIRRNCRRSGIAQEISYRGIELADVLHCADDRIDERLPVITRWIPQILRSIAEIGRAGSRLSVEIASLAPIGCLRELAQSTFRRKGFVSGYKSPKACTAFSIYTLSGTTSSGILR